jgi:hypothetical protein
MRTPVEADAAWIRELAKLGYTPVDSTVFAGRPDHVSLRMRTEEGAIVVAKFCPGRGTVAFENMQRVWASSFGEKRAHPGLPRPLEFLPGPGVLICENIDGRPLSAFPKISSSQIRGAMELLAALHSSDVQPDARRTARAIVRSAQRKAARVAELAPQYRAAAQALAESLEARRPKDTELVPSHGDFSPRNLLVASDRFALVDWDRLQWADPARDVVYFGISDWLPRLRRGRSPDRKLLDETIEVYCECRPSADLHKQIPFHIAAGLLRIACSLVELWPNEVYLVPALVSAAHRELDGA